jgi:hypothetical protein
MYCTTVFKKTHKIYVSEGYKANNDFIITYAEHSIITLSLVLFMLIFNKFEDLKYFPTLAKQFRRNYVKNVLL